MTRIAPVRLTFNPKTLWFDARDMELRVGDEVVVNTARGTDFGTVADPVFEMHEDDAKKLKTPLRAVKRLATDDDRQRREHVAARAAEALPVFRQMAAELVPDMSPVAVEFLFDSEKAVFYFASDDRVDFRELVRRLSAHFHVRVDLKQIGVRDGARIVGGYGHCGQELCCRRLGGDFNPVSIRMAKEQDLSLNPQKISGVCGRLMCCLRYEFDAYKDFHSRAPKKNARVSTPDGEGKVVDLDVPREIISIKVGDEKPVKVPLANMEPPEEGTRPNSVGQEAWDEANEPPAMAYDSLVGLFTNTLTGSDKLAEPGQVRHVHGDSGSGSGKQRSQRRKGHRFTELPEPEQPTRKKRRRRSTTVGADGRDVQDQAQQPSRGKSGKQQQADAAQGKQQPRKRSRKRGKSADAAASGRTEAAEQKRSVQVGRNSSALRAGREAAARGESGQQGQPAQQGARRRRRTHTADTGHAARETSGPKE